MRTGIFLPDGIVELDLTSTHKHSYLSVSNSLLKIILYLNNYGHQQTYLAQGPYTKFIYNLYTNKLVEGFIGNSSSIYNNIPVTIKDKLHILDEPNWYYKPDQLIFLEDDRYLSISFDNDINKYYLHPKSTRVKHVPMWLETPSTCLTDSLRILAKYLVTSRIQHKRKLYLGICHKHDCPPLKRVLLLSCLTNRLSRLDVNPELCYEINGHLQEYKGYTHNNYYTWYYLPILQNIEYTQYMDIACTEYSYLTPLKAYA
jgi:hypothetical protein